MAWIHRKILIIICGDNFPEFWVNMQSHLSCPSVLLSPCTSVLLFSGPFCHSSSCPTVLLSHCPPVPLSSCPPVPLSFMSSCLYILLSSCSSVFLSVCLPVIMSFLLAYGPFILLPSVLLSTCFPYFLFFCPPVFLVSCHPVLLSYCALVIPNCRKEENRESMIQWFLRNRTGWQEDLRTGGHEGKRAFRKGDRRTGKQVNRKTKILDRQDNSFWLTHNHIDVHLLHLAVNVQITLWMNYIGFLV